MRTEAEFNKALRDWVVKKNGKISPEELNDQTPIIERRIITSLQTLDLILFLEDFTGDAIDVEKLKPGRSTETAQVPGGSFAKNLPLFNVMTSRC